MTDNKQRFGDLLELLLEARSIVRVARHGDELRRATAIALIDAMTPEINKNLIALLGPDAQLEWKRDLERSEAIQSFLEEFEFAIGLLAPFFQQQFHEVLHTALPSLPTSL